MESDLHAFIASDALKGGPFDVHCSCGGAETIFPPFEEDCVTCPRCESRIMIHIVEGDPGYVCGADPNTGEPMLIPVQGSSEKAKNLSAAERERMLNQVRKKSAEYLN